MASVALPSKTRPPLKIVLAIDHLLVRIFADRGP
jgi:hypothetical protein